MKDLLLGVDIGTSSTKALVCNHHGKILVQAEANNRLLSSEAGWAEQSVLSWQKNTIQVIRACLAHTAVSAGQIAAVGVSGMVPALVLMDVEGKVLRPAIQYNDARAGREIQHFSKRIGAETFFNLTGASLSAQSIGPKWAWLQKNEAEICRRTSALMGSYDAINFFLTGNRHVERNWALESGLYDLNTRTWSADLLAQFELDPGLLPPILEPTGITGHIQAEIARLTGLLAGTPVVAGSADHVAAALAAGINHAGDVLIKFGSSGDILYCSDERIIDPRLYLDYHNIPGKYLPNGCMASSGSLLKWVVEQFCEADAAIAGQSGQSVYDFLNEKARHIPPGSAGVIVLPYFLGAKTPLNDTSARGVIFGLSLSHSRYHIYRAVMEAVAYGFRHHFEVLRDLGLPIRRVIASEGGARSPLWRQIAADVLDMPVHYLAENPGSAYGAAIVAGNGAGVLSSWDLGAESKHWGQKMEPRAHTLDVYQAGYQKYRELYPSLGKLFRK